MSILLTTDKDVTLLWIIVGQIFLWWWHFPSATDLQVFCRKPWTTRTFKT